MQNENVKTTAAVDAEAAFAAKGHEAAVVAPRFGQAHQQYFTPRWLCEAAYEIARHAFGLDNDADEAYYTTLNVIDPTCGSGRLLVPFKKGQHNVLGVELDDRLATTARRSLGKDHVRQGDVMAYGPVLRENAWHVAVVNPPYSLWWPVTDAYRDYELASDHNVESQHLVLELVTRLLNHYDGLLVAVMSGKFFANNPRAQAFLGKHYQVAANVTLPHPFKEEYGIDVDAAFVVATRDTPYSKKKPTPLTGPFEGGKEALVDSVNDAYDRVHPNPTHCHWKPAGPDNRRVYHLRAGWTGARLPDVPHLDMAVQVDTTTLPLRLTDRGVTAETPWTQGWFKFYSALPLQDYDAAQGCLTPLGEAYGSLPNILIAGAAGSRDRLTELGFDVRLTAHDAEQIAHRAARYERDRLPIRELAPAEYLAWYEDGPLTAQAAATLPMGDTVVDIPAGATYDLRVRWQRRDETVNTQTKGEGKKQYTLTTHVDRGYLTLRFQPTTDEHEGVTLKSFVVEEVSAGAVKALVDAFGLPQVRTVDALPAMEGWRVRLERFLDAHQAAAGGKRLYPTQALDVVRMATKSSVALLYEMGGGKTATIAHWAALRGYRTVVLVTPASVAPGIVEDLTGWGFPARRLNHSLITDLVARKRRHRLARQRVKTAWQRAPKLRQQLAVLLGLENGTMQDLAGEWGLAAGDGSLHDLDAIVREKVQALEAALHREETILHCEQQRLDREATLARKRRRLRNLLAIQQKGKAHNRATLKTEIEALQTIEIPSLTQALCDAHAALDDDYEPTLDTPTFYVTSYEDLSLGDHVGLFDAWHHEHYNRKTGAFQGATSNIRGARCPTCSAMRKKVVPACPQCGLPWRGEGAGGGRVCRACGHRAWTMGQSPKRMVPDAPPRGATSDQAKGIRRARIAALKEHRLAAAMPGTDDDTAFLRTNRQWPLGNRITKVFSCVLLDEAQEAKSKLSLRGAASRGLKANGKAVLTGTWMKGYVVDLFFTAGWLLGFGSPLWPFPYVGGSGRFLEQFGTFEYTTKEYADTLEVGRRKLIPSVSNLNRMWKLLSPVAIRRLKEDFLKDLPPKHRHTHWLTAQGKHGRLVSHVAAEAGDVLERELRKADPNMGAISMALWWERFVASCPNKYGALHYAGAWGHRLNVDESTPEERRAVLQALCDKGAYLQPRAALGVEVEYRFNKVDKALEILHAVKAAGEKAIVFTSLRGLYRTLTVAFQNQGIRFVGVDGVPTRKRNEVVRRFEASNATALLAGTGTLNRGVTVNGANHVLILNLEWSPETTLQAEDRCHRPGQTRDVHVHYLLGSGTVDEQMWDLVCQKAAAQRAVQDREAQYQSVEEILAEAAMANVQLAVARARLEAQFRDQGLSAEEAETRAVEELAARLAFGAVSPEDVGIKRRRRRSLNKATVVFVEDLATAPADEPVQLAMFAL